MNWHNVKLILLREVRDQLRDRRTLFMIAVLPLLLYPLLGMSFFQISQFMREQTTKVLVVEAPRLANLPALVEKDHFAATLLDDPDRARLLELAYADGKIYGDTPAQVAKRAHGDVTVGPYDAVVYFPPDFARRVEDLRVKIAERGRQLSSDTPPIPSPQLFYNEGKERSQITYRRVVDILTRWREQIGDQILKASHVPNTAARPFLVETVDVAEANSRKALLWSKILPFVLLIWALTGAFYPAIDLCAGEKERGTLETLLSSPAERREIVWGKLLTVMGFSMATAILNLLSMGICATFVMRQLPNFGPPPLVAAGWLLVALVPVSALFSALCIALASFARSTKEGQYYLMPLLMVSLPLTVLPMAPGVELTLGNSLIPVTGVVLLLRTLLEGNYMAAVPYVLPVVLVTLVCCRLAIRWAADQFNSESVLFRESERWDMGSWMKHLRRDREDTPSVSEAVFCGLLILLVQFFMSFALSQQNNLVTMALVSQIVVVATPALLMTIMLTRSPRKTLLLRLPPSSAILLAPLLAAALHPLAMHVQVLIQRVYPISEPIARHLKQLVSSVDDFWLLLLVGLIPAVCEELAFRGFILSGLRHLGNRWRAIVISSLFFGFAHPLLQQSISATLLGIIIGFIAVQTGSLLPGLLFHGVHNTLTLLESRITPRVMESYPQLQWFLTPNEGAGYTYTWFATVIGGVIAVAILVYFERLRYVRTAEESLQEAIEKNSGPLVPEMSSVD